MASTLEISGTPNANILLLIANTSLIKPDSLGAAMDGETIECPEPGDECINATQLPLNACRCELPANQFTPEYATFNLILIVIILPIVATFGVVTNGLALFVYTRTQMLASTVNIYLAALAISDIFVDICGISSIAIDSARRFDPLLNEVHLAIISYTLPLCYIAQMCSVYFTVLAAFDCYVEIRGPYQQSATLITNRRNASKLNCFRSHASVKINIFIVVIACFLYNGITFGDLHVIECVDYKHPEQISKKEVCPTELRIDPAYSQVYKVYMYAVFMTFLPFSILLILNCLIIWKIYKISLQKKAMAITKSDSINSDLDKSKDDEPSANETTLMLVMVVALFLICNSIALVVNIIETFGNYPMNDPDAANRLFFVIDIGNFLVVFNSSANFLIYYAFSKAFRAVLTRKRRKILGRLTASFSSLNTQYYLASSSIKINEDPMAAPETGDGQKQAPISAMEAAQAIAAVAADAVRNNAPQITKTSNDQAQFVNGKTDHTAKKSRAAYELLPIRRVSPTPLAAQNDAKKTSTNSAPSGLAIPTAV